MRRTDWTVLVALAVALATATGDARSETVSPFAPCAPPLESVVACENSKPGNPASEWDVDGAGDASIQGFATPFSANRGETVRFKVKTDAAAYRIDVYRLGYYGGLGARKVATLAPTAALPQQQPECVREQSTGLVDCGNWAESAAWELPADAVSGVYVGKLVRDDTGGESLVYFVVRDDERGSDVLFQTADTTWQAYNRYGGNSLYFGSPAGRAYKVSYNRPLTTRDYNNTSFFFNGEYPLLRWLERNGYDVSYTAGVDTAARGAELLEHEVFLSVGHDEYWSKAQRANVEAARDAGVSLAFFSGNEVFWKTRWEPSIDGSATPFTTLVSYKETAANAKIDPHPEWTGTWRDPRFSPPADGGSPENALTGTLFTVNAYREDGIEVPAAFGKLRLWRHTDIASLGPGEVATLPKGTLGHEWDEDVDNGFRPAGLMRLSSTTLDVNRYILDHGSTYGPGRGTHSLTLYRAASGALVFGAGTVQWGWGLDSAHDLFFTGDPRPPDPRMQQATVNLLADMGVQPASLQPELVRASQSTDATAPTTSIAAPADGATVQGGGTVTISGTAADAGGRVAGVEVSTDGGATWHPATGTSSWSYTWTAGGTGPATIRSRAVDDSGNLEAPQAGVTVTVVCPCTLFPATATPTTAATSDTKSIEVGLKFRSDVAGWITGLRFYKGAPNGGTHVGSLWRADGTLLARATFTGETGSGWQQVQFDDPVAISAATTYVASYFAPMGRYSLDLLAFSSGDVVNPPLRAPMSTTGDGNGLYTYTTGPAFPRSTHAGSNYWVDVVFDDSAPVDTVAPRIVATSPAAGAEDGDAFGAVEATVSEALAPATVTAATATLSTAAGAAVAAQVSWDAAARKIVIAPSAPLAYDAGYVVRIRGGAGGVEDRSGNALAADHTWAFTTAEKRTCPCTIWDAAAAPAVASSGDSKAVEVGVKLRVDTGGWISAIRFYKGSGNGGTHVGSLWRADGTLLARATFTSETATGWQQVTFDGPVAVVPGTTYVASYHAPLGRYAVTPGAFDGVGLANAPLRVLRDGAEGGNGVYRYSSSPAFPQDSAGASNYWVDVVYSDTRPPDAIAPTVLARTPAPGATGVDPRATVSARFSEGVDTASLASGFELRTAAGAAVPASLEYDAATSTATLRPAAPLELGAAYTARLRGGPTGVRDLAGNPLAADVSWGFTAMACPCSIWSAADAPAIPSSSDTKAVELGVRFRADRTGWVSGVRFYKGTANTGVHTGSLWTTGGALLARATFTGETASGWQSVSFDGPVQIQADTTYVVSYHAPNGRYAVTSGGFATAGTTSYLVRALRDGEDGRNGVFRYSTTPTFPTETYGAANYWVDVLFSPTRPADTTPPTVSSLTPAAGAVGVDRTAVVTARFSEPLDPASLAGSFLLRDASGGEVAATVAYDGPTRTATLTPAALLDIGRTYTTVLRGGAGGITDASGTPLAGDVTAPFTVKSCPCSIFGAATPATASVASRKAVEVGVKLRADVAGTIDGIRFYKGAGNSGPHVVSLWTAGGALLARADVPSSTSTGWQQALFATPVPIDAGVTYVASYFAPAGGYAVNLGYFGAADVLNPPLRALAGSTPGGNGVYRYATAPAFPTETYGSSNYWVDVVFSPQP